MIEPVFYRSSNICTGDAFSLMFLIRRQLGVNFDYSFRYHSK